jgi:hypothetical protein
MQSPQRFSQDILRLIDQTDEVQIEPRSSDGSPGKPVTIWIVVDGSDVFVRSYRGANGRWYQSLMKHPQGVLHVAEQQIPFRAIQVSDRESIDRVSQAFQRKYGSKWPQETAEMLRDEVLGTTLRLEPVSA